MPKWLEDIRNLDATLVGYKPLLDPSWGVEPMDEEEEYREPGEIYISPEKVAEVFCYRHIQTSTEELAQKEALLEQNTLAPLEDPILPMGPNEPTLASDKSKRKRKKRKTRESDAIQTQIQTPTQESENLTRVGGYVLRDRAKVSVRKTNVPSATPQLTQPLRQHKFKRLRTRSTIFAIWELGSAFKAQRSESVIPATVERSGDSVEANVSAVSSVDALQLLGPSGSVPQRTEVNSDGVAPAADIF